MGLATAAVRVLFIQNECGVADDRQYCYCLDAMIGHIARLTVWELVRHPMWFSWYEVSNIRHRWLEIDAMTVHEGSLPYGEEQ